MQKDHSAPDEAERELILAQYSAIRSEILLLMDSNERRVFSGLGIAGSILAILVSLLATGLEVPGLAFLLPIVILLMALNVHVLFAARTANMSAYLAEAMRRAGARQINWEHDIGEFALRNGKNLSSRVSVASVYLAMSVFAFILGLVASLSRLLPLKGLSLIALSDVLITAGVGVVLLVLLLKVQSSQMGFGEMKTEFEDFWRAYFSRPADQTGTGPET